MTTPLVLQIPVPMLRFSAVGGRAPLERAVAIEVGEVLFPDGTAMTSHDYASAVAVLTRITVAGAAPEAWDNGARAWKAMAGADLSQLGGIPLVPPTRGAGPWQGVLLGAAEKDAGGAPQIKAAAGQFPQYAVLGAFRAKRGTITAVGVGPESAPIEFGESVSLFEIDRSGPIPVITIVNKSSGGSPMARVRLEADGSISLIPLTGKRVIIQGDLEVEHVRYLPVASSIKEDL